MQSLMQAGNVAAAVAVIVSDNKKILLGRRYENNQFIGWQCPGGYLKKGETLEQAANRICLQKTGIEVKQLQAGSYSNNIFSEQLHTVTLYLKTEKFHIKSTKTFMGELAQWSWFDIEALPQPLFLPLQVLFEQGV